MSNKYKGTKTEENLVAAFAGESEARNKYTYFASIAKKEGYEQIAALFIDTANNEKEHAKLWFKELGLLGDTASNLMAAAAGENYEWTEMYAEMAKVAREEGFMRIAAQMDMVAKIEKSHEERYTTLKNNVDTEKVFAKDEKVTWICDICGYEHTAEKAPGACPLCGYSKAHFAEKADNWK